MDKHGELINYLAAHQDAVGVVVDINYTTDRLYQFDFTASNKELSPEDVADTEKFDRWITAKLRDCACRYGIGGYLEHRTLYGRSDLFNTGSEPRRLHLGVDIWAPAGTSVYAPLNGVIHSFRDNNHFGDYGPAIVLMHHLGGLTLFSLYGHLTRSSLNRLRVGQAVEKGSKIGELGNMDENGSWPPHLHFQLMFDMEGNEGDYPGVCALSERARYEANIPDPELILKFKKATIIKSDC